MPAATFRVILEYPSFPAHSESTPVPGTLLGSEAAFEAGSSSELIGCLRLSLGDGGATMQRETRNVGNDKGLQQFNKICAH